MSFITPAEQVRMYFDDRDRAYEAKAVERRKSEADRLFADPISLSLVIAEAMDEEPMKWGMALQSLRDGDSFPVAALATAAVYESLS